MRDMTAGLRTPFIFRRRGPSPSLSLNFLQGALDPRITFTRASTASYFDSAGILRSAAVDTPRLDYDPATLQPKGLLIEGARTNLLLNSATLATQSVTVTAQSYTLSFWGTGTVTLSGAYVGSLVGTGAANRVMLTFTAAAGTLTATVSGSVTLAQLEAGVFASAYTPTTAAPVTRADDVAVMTGANFSNWFNASKGTFVVEFSTITTGFTASGAASFPRVFSAESSATESILGFISGGGGAPIAFEVKSGGVTVAQLAKYSNIFGTGARYKMAGAYRANNFAASIRGDAALTDMVGAIPTCNQFSIGGGTGSGQLDGHIRRIDYYRTRLSNADLQRLTA